MTSTMRSLRDFRNPIGFLVLLAAFAAAGGCSTAESPAGSGNNMNHILPDGSSVSGWLVTPSGGTHAGTATTDYIANNGSSGCTQCHGSDLSGGISKVSCFGNPAGCHHDPVANWTTPAVHGATAKKAPGSSGFASCQICHGSDFSGGGANVSCFACHGVNAPHPPKPWRSAAFTHTNTNTSNAPVCRQCHFPGSPNNPAGRPATPAPAGTAPGCFNSTLCHGEAGAPHPLGNPAWMATPPAPQPHGNIAKATPGSASGFAYCQVCHGTGTDFAGGPSGVSCYPCHGANSPHPANWVPGDSYVHTSTDPGNASVCAFCHRKNPGTPGCFNNTLCHAHPLGAAWVAASPAAQPHGNSAKAADGFPSCQTCHGNNFAGGSVNASCLNNSSCHGAGVASPHPPGPWRTSAGSTYTHTNTIETGNPPVCYTCHAYTGTSNPNNPHPPPSPAQAGTLPGCFNGTMCHNEAVPHPVGGLWFAFPPEPQAHGNAAKATPSSSTGFVYCQTCHGSGTNFDGGSSGVSCFTTCHFATAPGPVNTPYPPHPAQWRVNDTYKHQTTDTGNGSVCAHCHTGGSNSPMPLIPQLNTPPGTSSCYNNTLCHGTDGYHQASWGESGQHGPAAMTAQPSAYSGFAACKTCHGTGTTPPANFGGGAAEVSCYGCHLFEAPHPDPGTSNWNEMHQDTNQAPSNVNVCAQCHRRNPDPNPGEASGCLNNTLCHGN